MRNVIIAFAVAMSLGVFIVSKTISPKSPSPSSNPSPSDMLQIACNTIGGTWKHEYKECSGIGKESCEKIGGKFDGCASPCRHESDPNKPCIMLCEEVCMLEKFSDNQNKTEYNGKNISFSYSPSAKITSESENSVKMVYVGEIQKNSGRTQTELFDGYIFEIQKIENPQNSLENQAQYERKNAIENCVRENGEISQLTERTIDRKRSLGFSVKNCYSEYTMWIVNKNEDLYRVLGIYSSPDNNKLTEYIRETNNIINSLKFLEAETSPQTSCKFDSDCFCRNFTGAGFMEGKSEGVCDTKAGRCTPCTYL